ncbi:MAG TPA: ABC transporter ATP-binding protein [Rhabdaerophilum sp.]|nr:ABC transporter ATP-binding protein [Rhabdaerophilum sp.]
MNSRRSHSLTLDRISHRFGEFQAVRDITLEIAAGELVALLGPSGCGKSTLLRIISGFIAQTSGTVLFDGSPVDHLTPRRRGVGIVFQNYALFPHMTVRQNIAYGLEAQNWPKAEITPRVNEMLALVQMSEMADRKPSQLSGGQQQRIALARCLAVDPKILLLDEPFGALDKNLRLDMQIEVKRLQREYGITTVLVTHDQEEALSMADRVAVMNRGVIEQIASPTDIYDKPATLFVNEFVGTTNILRGEIVHTDGTSADVRVDDEVVLRCRVGIPVSDGQPVSVSVRPESLRFAREAGPGRIRGIIKAVMPLGPNVLYEIETARQATMKISLSRVAGNAPDVRLGTAVFAEAVTPESCLVFSPARQGQGHLPSNSIGENP